MVELQVVEDFSVKARDLADLGEGWQPPNNRQSRRGRKYNASSTRGTDFALVAMERGRLAMLPDMPDHCAEVSEPVDVLFVHDGEVDDVRLPTFGRVVPHGVVTIIRLLLHTFARDGARALDDEAIVKFLDTGRVPRILTAADHERVISWRNAHRVPSCRGCIGGCSRPCPSTP